MSEETFGQIVDRLAVDDELGTALRMLDELGVKSKRSVSLLAPLVRDEVRRIWRQTARYAERRSSSFLPAEISEEIALDRKRLLSERFFNGVGYVLWGEATVEDHRSRIEYLAKLRAGVDESIQTHEAAIVEIESHGVSCLNEIRGAA